jgi:hypothetical protein
MRELSFWEILLTPLRIKWVDLLLVVVARRSLRALAHTIEDVASWPKLPTSHVITQTT